MDSTPKFSFAQGKEVSPLPCFSSKYKNIKVIFFFSFYLTHGLRQREEVQFSHPSAIIHVESQEKKDSSKDLSKTQQLQKIPAQPGQRDISFFSGNGYEMGMWKKVAPPRQGFRYLKGYLEKSCFLSNTELNVKL